MYSEIFFKLRLSLRLDLRPLVKLDPYACLKGDLMEMDNYIFMPLKCPTSQPVWHDNDPSLRGLGSVDTPCFTCRSA